MARRPGNLAVLAYDAADRLTTLTTPLGTTTSVYDSAGQLTDQTDAYDSGGRRTGETWVGASPSEAITYTYDADGELTGAKDGRQKGTAGKRGHSELLTRHPRLVRFRRCQEPLEPLLAGPFIMP